MSDPDSTSRQQPSALRFLPLVLFALLAALFLVRLFAGDASRLPSALIDKSAPNFDLPALAGLEATPGLKTGDLRQGHVSLVNVFASWCAPCRQEHPTLMRLANDETLKAMGVEIYGLSYKDEQENALGLLKEEGNPFRRIGVDPAGRTAIDFGVYGVPETFIVAGDGTIAYKFVGPMSPAAVEKILLPAIQRAAQKTAPAAKSSAP
jgi:cytochrome c biogenesis protein CcmG/thiol:disulfide interchange protein DsbE